MLITERFFKGVKFIKIAPYIPEVVSLRPPASADRRRHMPPIVMFVLGTVQCFCIKTERMPDAVTVDALTLHQRGKWALTHC